MTSTQPRPPLSLRQIWNRTPKVWVFGAVIAATGWIFSFGSSSTLTVNGETTCTGTDLAPYIVAGVVLVSAIAGVSAQRREHPARRLPPTHTWTIVAVLALAAAAYLVSAWVNPAGNFC